MRRGATSIHKYGSCGIIVAVIAAAGGLSLRAHTQFRSSVSMVPVFVTVQDATGHLVADLPRESFQVFDDGRPVEIVQFSTEPQPLRVAVMLDTSMSLQGLRGERNADAVLDFVRALSPVDRASLGTFGAQVAVGANMTNDLAEFSRVLREEVWIGGGTPLWQAIAEAIDSLGRVEGRRVVLVYTDGVDTGSFPGSRDNSSTVQRQALQSDCMLYFIRPARTRRWDKPLPDYVKDLARATGGGHVELQPDGDPKVAFAGVVEELHQQYLLGFRPPVLDDKLHRIDVRTTHGEHTIRARSGYFARADR